MTSAVVPDNCYYVYVLVDPINRIPFYVGKGKGNRMYQHLKGDKRNKKKVRYIDNIRMLGFEPFAVKVMDNLTEYDAYSLERIGIKYYKSLFPNLTNIKSVNGLEKTGRNKGYKWSEESIRKRSQTVRENHKNGYRRPPMTEDQKQKLREFNLGKEGPNKVYVDVNELKKLYLDMNMTKDQVMKELNIGMATLNRVISENGIRKVNQYKYRTFRNCFCYK